MQNPKTGTTWTPDIRPENIETFEETYTPEGGEQQTITYKAVDNHPILNKVLDKFAFFKSHVSAIWYNKLANITLKQKLDEMDAGLEEVSAKMRTLKYVEDRSNAERIEFDAHCYVTLTPPGTRNYLFATIKTFGSTNTVLTVTGRDRSFWLLGTNGKTVVGLELRYWYMD